MANKLANNSDVIANTRNPESAQKIHNERSSSGQALQPNVSVTNSLEEVATSCNIIFPVVPSSNFREMMIQLAPS